MTYEEVAPIGREEAQRAFDSNDARSIVPALLGATFHEEDWPWVQEWCLRFLDSTDSAVRGTAITCLGHLARLHQRIDKARVMSALESHAGDPEFAGRIEDAMDDIEMFAR